MSSAAAPEAIRPQVVVVPVDGSRLAEEVLPVAHHLASVFRAVVQRVTVSPAGAEPGAVTPPGGVEVGAGHAAETRVRADVVLTGSDPVEALLAHLATVGPAVVCMSSHGRGGLRRRLVGSVAEQLIQRSPAPVVVVGPELRHELLTLAPRSLVVAVGPPPVRDELLPAVAAWAAALHARVVLCHVAPRHGRPAGGHDAGRGGEVAATPAEPDLDGLAAWLAEAGIDARAEHLAGDDPVPALLEVAGRLLPPVLVVAQTHRRGEATGGDVAYRLIQDSRWPVLATVGTDPVPPTAPADEPA
jgi:nucleotide-binding universal stress UspA family protein